MVYPCWRIVYFIVSANSYGWLRQFYFGCLHECRFGSDDKIYFKKSIMISATLCNRRQSKEVCIKFNIWTLCGCLRFFEKLRIQDHQLLGGA